MKKLVVLLSLIALFASVFSGVSHADSSTNQVEIIVLDEQGKPIDDAYVWFHVYDKGQPALVLEDRTDAQGKVAMSGRVLASGLASYDGYKDYTFHVYHPKHGLIIQNWTEPNNAQFALYGNVVLQYGSCSKNDLSPMRYGSGIFRIEMVHTKTDPQLVDFAEMYRVPGLYVEASYESGVNTQVQTKAKFLMPAGDDWSVTGSRTRSTGSSGVSKWTSNAIPAQWHGMVLRTEFNFAEETWELQEMDGDIPDVWHTVQRWVDVKMVGHHGSCVNGPFKISSNNNKPYAEVVQGQHGTRYIIGPTNTEERKLTSSHTFSLGTSFNVSTPYGNVGTFSANASVTYDQKVTFKFTNQGSTNAAVYNMNLGGYVWYASRQ